LFPSPSLSLQPLCPLPLSSRVSPFYLSLPLLNFSPPFPPSPPISGSSLFQCAVDDNIFKREDLLVLHSWTSAESVPIIDKVRRALIYSYSALRSIVQILLSHFSHSFSLSLTLSHSRSLSLSFSLSLTLSIYLSLSLSPIRSPIAMRVTWCPCC
jgi:hypothetical protein